MTAPTPPTSIQELREEFEKCEKPQQYMEHGAEVLDRLEAAESRVRDLDLQAWVDRRAAVADQATIKALRNGEPAPVICAWCLEVTGEGGQVNTEHARTCEMSPLASALTRIKELEQLMAQGWSKARDYEARYFRLSKELYKNQCILDGTPTVDPTWTCGPEPVDDVSSLLSERLKRDAVRIADLEANQQPRPMEDAPPNQVPILGHHVSFGWFTIRRIGESMVFISLHGGKHVADTFAGWLPLPDQSTHPDREDSPDRPEICASGKTEL